MSEHSGERVPLPPRWEFVRIVRQPSGFGVAKMTVWHGEKGSVVIDLMPSELHALATQVLECMVPLGSLHGSSEAAALIKEEKE